MKQCKKMLCAFGLGLAMAVTSVCGVCAPSAVYAEDTVGYLGEKYVLNTEGDWQYIVKDNQVVIMGYTSTAPAVTVPQDIAGRPVVAIGKNSNYSGKGAFEDNSSMQTVTIPASVTYIDARAFKNCTGLQQALISDGVTEIGEEAFADCSYLQRVQFKGAALRTIGDSAFSECVALDQVTIPESVTTIGNRAFAGASALSYIKIPDSVTSLGGGAFAGCTVLEEAVIGNGVPVLGAYGSGYNAGTDHWSTGCFESCPSLLKVTIGTGVETIGQDAFAGAGLLELVIPDNVVTVEAGAFYDCENMKTAVIGDGVKTMGDKTFFSCGALESVTIGKNVRTMGVRTFTENVSLKEIVIPSNVISLGGASFAGCTSLTKAVIGNGVTELGAYGSDYNYGTDHWSAGMFEGCTSLSEVEIGNGVIIIGRDAFAGTALETVTIPDNVVTVDSGAFMNCQNLCYATIGDGVTAVNDQAFSGDVLLSSIHIGKGVVSIGYRAFRDCRSLRNLLIPSNVTSLGGGLCVGCSSLQRVIIGNGVTSISHYGSDYNSGTDYWSAGAFESCAALTDVSLGSGLTSIGVDTFAGTAITSLLIPAKVSGVEKGAFCSNSFQNLYFTGSAPTIDNVFSTSTPYLYKIAGKYGYDNLGYIFNDFTPITVRFDLNNSDVFAIQPNDQYMTPEGGYVIEPLDPMAEGYRFLGWYKDSACTQKWDFLNDKVTADTTVYASWVKTSEAPPVAPKALECTSVTGSSAVITWQAVDGATGYQVYVDGVEVTTAPVSECTYQIRNLKPDSTYEVTVVAVNVNGSSYHSLVKVVQTSEETVLLGDADGDGSINAKDALKVLRFVVNLDVPTAQQKEAADVTGNGVIEATDALMILKYVVSLISAF